MLSTRIMDWKMYRVLLVIYSRQPLTKIRVERRNTLYKESLLMKQKTASRQGHEFMRTRYGDVAMMFSTLMGWKIYTLYYHNN